ncbi:uncharacterized protein LOC128230737 [Mya arenaria]|uniref:uncharacterized protein LOC128230737 n=1 Tax=Mya arenaria TaxID=6604 RepID=UPI0022E738DA|nr:uncharacterized protein LOC128230737 [Mya arenaria]
MTHIEDILPRLCNSISHLPDLAKGFHKKTEFKQLSATVDKMRSRLDELKKAGIKYQDELKDSYKKAIAEIKALRMEIDSILNQLEKATIEQVENMIGDFENDVKDDVEKCMKINDQLKNLMEKINQLVGKRKETTSYIGYRKCTVKLTQANDLVGEIQRRPKKEIQVVSDKTIESFLESLKTLGLIDRKCSKAHKDCLYQVVRSKQFNVKIQEDKELCIISGVCELASGHIVISDGNNYKVKLLNSDFQVIEHCEIPAPDPPCCICHIAASEVAVAVCSEENNNHIQFIKVSGGTLQKMRKFTTDHPCTSIAHHKGHLYVCSGTVMFQYTMDVELVKKIHEDKTGKCTVLQCAVCPDGERIYVSNLDKNKLISLDQCGQILAAFDDPELVSPSGVCVGLSSQVFVGTSNNTVMQLDSEGTKKLATVAREVDRINNPLSVVFIESTSTLIVGGYENDNIVVLQLERI